MATILTLDDDERDDLAGLLGAAIQDLHYEIAATDSSVYKEGLHGRLARLEAIAGRLTGSTAAPRP
jgi:hypothetical protein